MRETSKEHKKILARARTKKWRKANRQKCIDSDRAYQKKHPLRHMLTRARNRAKEKGIEFTVTEEDLLPYPLICPVLNIELIYRANTGGKPHYQSASLDRYDNNVGYTKDNTKVISWRANELKKDGTLEEFKLLIKYLEDAK